jgi:hypothetical protein
MTRELTIRQKRIRSLLEPIAGTGLEVGPLCDPLFVREDTDVRYIDIHDGDALRAHYAGDPAVRPEDVIDPDYVIIGPEGPRSLADAIGDATRFSWAVASHVVEHVPDIIGWLDELADILDDDGLLALVVPDRRFSFDAGREPTTVGEMLLAHHTVDRTPSVRAIYDHFSRAVKVSTAELWAGAVATSDTRMYSVHDAAGFVDRAVKEGVYIDSHVWMFTPGTFVEQLTELGWLGLTDFSIERVLPTARNELEFSVLLRRLPRGLDRAGRDQRRAAGMQELLDYGPDPEPTEEPLPGRAIVELSRREAQLVHGKRAVMIATRSLTNRLKAKLAPKAP